MPSYYRASYDLHWQSTSGAEVSDVEAEPDRFNFLSFLATVQALEIEFLPIAWDASGDIGAGGTSRIHQTLVNLNTSFAFKTYYKQDKTEEQIFRTLIAEITVLSQPFIQAPHENPCYQGKDEDKSRNGRRMTAYGLAGGRDATFGHVK